MVLCEVDVRLLDLIQTREVMCVFKNEDIGAWCLINLKTKVVLSMLAKKYGKNNSLQEVKMTMLWYVNRYQEARNVGWGNSKIMYALEGKGA